MNTAKIPIAPDRIVIPCQVIVNGWLGRLTLRWLFEPPILVALDELSKVRRLVS